MKYTLNRCIAAGFPRRAIAVTEGLSAGLFAVSVSACGPSQAPQAIIIAASASATATANEPAPELSAGIVQMLQSAGAASTKATACVVAPGTGQPTILPLTPRRADGHVDFGPRPSLVLAANVAAVQRAVEQEAAHGPFDLLNTMAAAAGVAPPSATLVVISSGLSTAGGLDMRQVGWDANPQSVASHLKTRGLLPDLTGYRVVFSGLADVAGRQAALPLPQRTTLVSYWMAICRASGAASCVTDDLTRADPPSHSTIGVPVVAVPAVTSVHGPGATTVALPDSLNSATLLSSADSIVQPIADQDLQLSITGHASPDGGTRAYNEALSIRRAMAVRNRLLALGLPAG
jgi:hypothetical protein